MHDRHRLIHRQEVNSTENRRDLDWATGGFCIGKQNVERRRDVFRLDVVETGQVGEVEQRVAWGLGLSLIRLIRGIRWCRTGHDSPGLG